MQTVCDVGRTQKDYRREAEESSMVARVEDGSKRAF